MRSRTHERARAFYYLFHYCFEIIQARTIAIKTSQRQHRFVRGGIGIQLGRKGRTRFVRTRSKRRKERENERMFFLKRKLRRRDFTRNFKVARNRKEKKRERDCGETISHAFGKGGIADERKGGQRFDGGLLGTVRRPFGSTGSGTTVVTYPGISFSSPRIKRFAQAETPGSHSLHAV